MRNQYLTVNLDPFNTPGLTGQYLKGFYSKEELPDVILGSSFVLDTNEMVEIKYDHRHVNISNIKDYLNQEDRKEVYRVGYRKVNVNIDSYEDLIKVKGIGKNIANKILELRANKTLTYEDLKDIKGFDNWNTKINY